MPQHICGVKTCQVDSYLLTVSLDPNRYVDMNSCIHRVPTGDGVRATSWPANWPARLETTPKWLSSVPKGIYGKHASEEFVSDTTHWQNVVTKSYFKALGIEWEHIRNVLDMKAGYGGYVNSQLSVGGISKSVFRAIATF